MGLHHTKRNISLPEEKQTSLEIFKSFPMCKYLGWVHMCAPCVCGAHGGQERQSSVTGVTSSSEQS